VSEDTFPVRTTARVGAPRLAVLKALGDNTRYAIYLELARSSQPLATAEIAETLDLHPNTVRPHLERMREVGLLDVETDARGNVGRPQHRYSLAADAPTLGLEPATFPVLSRMLVRLAATAGLGTGEAVEAGREQGGLDALDAEVPTAPWPTTRARRPWPSPAARSASSPKAIPTWSAACTGGWSRGSWTRRVVPGWTPSTR
jgi:DNA-binding transcriptional ArsR family regulator